MKSKLRLSKILEGLVAKNPRLQKPNIRRKISLKNEKNKNFKFSGNRFLGTLVKQNHILLGEGEDQGTDSKLTRFYYT